MNMRDYSPLHLRHITSINWKLKECKNKKLHQAKIPLFTPAVICSYFNKNSSQDFLVCSFISISWLAKTKVIKYVNYRWLAAINKEITCIPIFFVQTYYRNRDDCNIRNHIICIFLYDYLIHECDAVRRGTNGVFPLLFLLFQFSF